MTPNESKTEVERGFPESLIECERVRAAARALVTVVQEQAATRTLDARDYAEALLEIERLRGRPLLYPLLSSGCGRGARVRLADGSEKIDFISGIGVYGLGHADPDLLETAVVAAAGDVLFQGHLAPGPEYLQLSRTLLRHAGGRLEHVWLSISGAMANENAIKMIYQKKHPADRIVVFERAFHGRTLAMAELTDRPALREGLPLAGRVLHVPFFDPGAADSAEHSLAVLDAHLRRYPGAIAGMCFELVQGEGGFHTAPPEFFVPLMARCREAGVAVWVDEVQTFARTGELFAFRTLGLEEWVDVVSVGKMLQGSAALFSREFNPRPGLVAGTYAGNSVGMAVGARLIERLETEGFLGPEGRVVRLGEAIERWFDALAERMPAAVGARSGLGAMRAFVPWPAQAEQAEIVRALLDRCFEEGLILLGAGREPSKLRMLPPLVASEEELELAFGALERALHRVAEQRDLPC